MIGLFVHWWVEQMAGLLPSCVRRSLTPDALVLAAEGDTLRLLHRRRGRERPMGDVPLAAAGTALPRLLPRRRIALVLRIATGLLERDVTLPLAAERDPARVLRYELDRLTPFGADDVVWDWMALRRDPVRARLHLRLWLVPRRLLVPLLTVLADARLAPAVLEVAAPRGGWRTIRLHPSSAARRTAPVLAGAASAVLALAALATPFLRQSAAASAVDARIAALRPLAAEAASLRRQAAAGGDVVAAERTRLGDAVAAIAAVTEALPDDTFLTALTLRQRRLGLGGESRGAAALIARLAADARFRNPSFAAPVTRSDGGRAADRFEINADLAP
jgi:general secretion pathway protein L